jgi:aminodeoxychorismate synthase component I
LFEPPGFAVHALREFGACEVLDAFERLRAAPYPWLLDSALREPRFGRYSFLGADPYLVMRVRGQRVELECRRAIYDGLTPGECVVEAPAFDVLRGLLPPRPRSEPAYPFAGGVVGYLGYELAEQFDSHALRARDDLELPDAVLLFVDSLLAFDHESQRCSAIGLGFGDQPQAAESAAEAAVRRLEESLEEPPRPSRSGKHMVASSPGPDIAPAAHAEAVNVVKDEIAAGNVYQACLTHRVERSFVGDPWVLYRSLREINPAPFACFMDLPEVSVIGSSPERFLKVTFEGSVESRPIKGTRPRGQDAAQDESNRRALAESTKDRAENLMIVDLVRNDLGRVCETGSVHVPDLMAIEPYASVFQMVSTICGQLREDLDVLDLIRATFPPGSMTGAPKIAAMRLLDNLESVRRGIYSGAIGYLDARGGADLSVVIRTLFVRSGRAYLHAGGGIVADSEPTAEHEEALDKLRPLLTALEMASAPDR